MRIGATWLYGQLLYFLAEFVWGFIKHGYAYENVNAAFAGRKRGPLLGTDSPKGRSIVARLKAKGLGWRREVPK